MAKIIGLPKLSPTMDEGTLARWVKKEGDAVEVDDLLAEVDTDKATMEFRSFDKGVLLKILAPEGTTLAPDAPVCVIGAPGEDVSALVKGGGAKASLASGSESAPKPRAASESAAAAPAPSSPAGAAHTASAARSESGAAPPPASASAPSSAIALASAASGRVLASPYVRKLAREQNLDLTRVAGSGPLGRIVARDLGGAPQATAQLAPSAGAPVPTRQVTHSNPNPPNRPASRVEKVSQMRKAIARRLSESKREVPHFYLTVDPDVDDLVRAREDMNRALELRGEKVSLNDLLIKATALALRRVPECNASFADTELHFHNRVDISVAVAVPDGLLTPVIRDADLKTVLAIAHEVRDLAARAKAKKLKPEEMSDGTFSISNLGMFGIDSFSAVINPPEGAILAIGRVREVPVVRNRALMPGKKLSMTLSCDHRVVDGAVGAKFLQALVEILAHPAQLAL